MQNIQEIKLIQETREEQLPGFALDFPYIATCAQLDKYADPFVPWHWHKAVELFYMEEGSLEYETPGGKIVFPQGSGGLVNSNVLHKTRILDYPHITTQKLHIFDPAFLSGQSGGRIEQTYFLPMLADPMFEIIPLSPDVPEHSEILHLIQKAFLLNEHKVGYEISLHRALLDIWLKLFVLYRKQETAQYRKSRNIDTVKRMMIYIREHLADSLTVKELADAVFLSERECYRIFRDCLHTTPVNYIIDCRLQEASRMLTASNMSVTEIAYSCGFGSGSYFSRVFTREKGCTPNEYRANWQDKTSIRR